MKINCCFSDLMSKQSRVSPNRCLGCIFLALANSSDEFFGALMMLSFHLAD